MTNAHATTARPASRADRQAGRQRDEHDAGVLRIADARAIADEAGGADDRKRARQVLPDDDDDQRSDDGEENLRLHHMRRTRHERAAHRPDEAERRAKSAGGREYQQILCRWK